MEILHLSQTVKSIKKFDFLGEIIFTIFWIIFGVAFYSFIIGIISAFFTQTESKNTLLQSKLENLDDICRKMKVHPNIENEIKKATEYSAQHSTYLWLDPDMTILKKLPIQMKYNFLVSMYKEIIQDCPFFYNFDISFIVRVVPLLKPLHFKSGEYIVRSGEYSSNIFFLTKGKTSFVLETIQANKKRLQGLQLKKKTQTESNAKTLKMICNPEKEHLLLFKQMTNGSYFGETDIIYSRRRNCSVVATTDCDMYTLGRTVLQL